MPDPGDLCSRFFRKVTSLPLVFWCSHRHILGFFVPVMVLETPIYGRQGAYTQGEIKTWIFYDFCLCLYPLVLPQWETAFMSVAPTPLSTAISPWTIPQLLESWRICSLGLNFQLFSRTRTQVLQSHGTLRGLSELSSQVLCSFGSDVSLSAPEFLEGCGDLCSNVCLPISSLTLFPEHILGPFSSLSYPRKAPPFRQANRGPQATRG